MKKITINCIFDQQTYPFTVYIGAPEPAHHPLHFQAEWLQKERGGSIPTNVMESLEKLHTLAEENNLSFEDLCVYALGSAEGEDLSDEDLEQFKQTSNN